MKKYKLDKFKNGWLVGDFEPSIIKTKEFEFLVRHYVKGDKDKKHVHRIADEITVVVRGTFKMNGDILVTDDVVHLSPGDVADFECVEDGSTAVIKSPSAVGDKYLL